MATGDILSIAILAEGDRADITIEGLSTGGTYALGMGADMTITAAKPKITLYVTSKSYDDAGNPITKERQVYGKFPTRKIYPDEADNEESTSGGNVTVRVWLTDFIYSTDKSGVGNSGVDIVADIQAGFYTQGSSNVAGRNITVTNNSTLAHLNVVGNWLQVGYERITGSTFTLRCGVAQHHAELGRPVRLVRFSATDGTNTVTTDVLSPTMDLAYGDEIPVLEYIGTLSSSTLTQGAVITCNFVAYPWIGDSTSILDTSTGTAPPTPLYGPIKLLNDKDGTYGLTYALVDPTGSDAGANTVYDSAVFDPVTAYKFLTIGKAASAIAAYNNTNHSRNDVGGGIVYLNAGTYAWLGSSNSYGTTPDTWITVEPSSGTARSAVTIGSASGNSDISDRVKIKNVTITASANNTFTNCLATYFNNCDFNTSGTGIFNSTGGTYWVVHGLARQVGQGFRANSTANVAFGLVRGIDLSGFAASIGCYTVVGNVRTGAYSGATIFVNDYSSGMTAPDPFNFYIANNEIYGFDALTVMLTVGTIKSNTFGGAIISNVFENALLTGANGMWDISASDGTATNTPNENFIIWHNTVVGQRCFIGYNDAGSTTKYRRYWSQKNNYWDRWANKGDVFTPQNANRFGAHNVNHMIGGSGNVLDQNMHSIPSNFYAESVSLSTYQPAYGAGGAYTDADFIDRKASTESVAGAGDGNYRLGASSICIGRPIDHVLPYDNDGNPHYLGDAAGAYTYGTASTKTRSFTVC